MKTYILQDVAGVKLILSHKNLILMPCIYSELLYSEPLYWSPLPVCANRHTVYILDRCMRKKVWTTHLNLQPNLANFILFCLVFGMNVVATLEYWTTILRIVNYFHTTIMSLPRIIPL